MTNRYRPTVMYPPGKPRRAERLKKLMTTSVGNYLQWQMTEDKEIKAQINEYHKLLEELKADKINLPDVFVVGALVEKLPSSWNDYKQQLKSFHKPTQMSLADLIKHILIEDTSKKKCEAARARTLESQANLIQNNARKRVDNDSSDDDLHEVECIPRSGKRQIQARSKRESRSQQMGEALSADDLHVRRVDNDSSDDDLHEVECIPRSGKRQIQARSKRESRSQQTGEALSAWAKAFLAKAERYRDKSVEATSHVTLDCSLTKCVAALDELEDISDDAYGQALEKLTSPEWREVFIAMSNERKRGWVLRLLE